jgi:hypothetical protein
VPSEPLTVLIIVAAVWIAAVLVPFLIRWAREWLRWWRAPGWIEGKKPPTNEEED